MDVGLLAPRRGERALPALSGVLLALSFPPVHLLVPPFVALAPLGVWVARLEAGADGRGAAARGGLLFGVVHFALLLHWIVPALAWVTALAVPAFVAVLALLGALGGGVGWTLHRAVHGVGAPLWLALPVTWTAGEWVRAHLPGSLSFPWLELGTALTGFPELAGAAELVGTRGLSFWMATVNGLLAGAVLAWRDARTGGPRERAGSPEVAGSRAGQRAPRPRARARSPAGVVLPAGAALLVAALPAAWGLWRAGDLTVFPAARVAVVQPNVPAGNRRTPEEALRHVHEALDTLLPRAMAGPPGTPGAGGPGAAGRGVGDFEATRPDLVVLPEGAFPFDLRAPESAATVAALSRHAAALGAPLMVGAYGAPEPGAARLNSVFVVTPAGPVGTPYHKRRLVPLVEDGPIGAFGGGARGGDPGVRQPVAGLTLAVSICYEAVFQEDARRARAAGADLLVNVTNDAWYGDASGGGRTVALRQHPAHLVMRAIETRAGAVRAANTGVSFFVDPVGRTHGELPVSEAGVTVAEVRTTDVRTAFVRFGDLVGRAAVLSALLLATWPVGRGRRGPGTPARDGRPRGGSGPLESAGERV